MSQTQTLWILGASSEIGNAYASLKSTTQALEIRRVGRKDSTLSFGPDYIWDSTNLETTIDTLQILPIKKNDEVVIAPGFLGTYGGWGITISRNRDEIIDLVSANLVAPTMALLFFIERFSRLSGGRIVLLSSLAAHPVLDINPIYGQMKRFLDDLACSALKSKALRRDDVEIVIARIGFVPTKLNRDRSSGGFSTTLHKIAKKISQKKRGVVWSPTLGRLAIVLKFLPFGKALASKLLAELAK